MDEREFCRLAPLAGYLALDNELDRFDYVTELAFQAPGIPKACLKEENRVKACDSRLWYGLSIADGSVALTVESDSLFVKGLAVILSGLVAKLPVNVLAREPLGLGALLCRGGFIPPARERGLDELERQVCAFAQQCQNTQSS